jgi:lysophospholipase L1-like esterase
MTQPVDIVFLGGSSTECGYVDEELRFPYRVGQLLNIGSGLTARTLNGGVSGNHSLHSLIQYLAKTAPLRPRYVVLMHNVNDLVLLSKTGSYWQAPPSRALVSSHPAVTPTPIINLAALVDPFMELGFSTKPTEKIDEWSKYRDGNHQVDQEEIEKQFQSSLTSFVNIVRAFGSRPILMTQLNRFKPDDEFIRATYEREWQPLSYESFVKLYARFNEIVRVVSNLNEVHLIDLDKSMPENNSLLYDAVHLNGEGSSMVASLIANEIRFTDGDYFIKK